MSNLYRESFSMEIIANCRIHILCLWTILHPVFLQCLHIILLHLHALLYTVHTYLQPQNIRNISILTVRRKPVTSCLQMVQECTMKT